MKTVKKWIAFMLAAGLIVSAVRITAVTVLADDSYGYTVVDSVEDFSAAQEGHDYSSGGLGYYSSNMNEGAGGYSYSGHYPPKDPKSGDYWWNPDDKENCAGWKFNGTDWVDYSDPSIIFTGPFSSGDSSGSSSGDSSSSSLSSEEERQAILSQAADAAEQQGASDEGFLEVNDMYRAAEKNMSAGEYYNNAVISTPGIENAVTVGQGGHIVVNGVVTNMTAMISKVTNRAYVDSARVNEPEGRLLNVVEVSYPGFDATINFYMPSVTAEMDVVALQYSAGTWVNVDVAEVREDHVVLNMKKSGIVAFVAKEMITE